MTKCIELSLALPPIPTIPNIFLGGGIGLNISFGTVGVTCCNYTIPAWTPTIPIPMIGPLAVLVQTINALLIGALPVLDSIQIPKCPI